MSDDLVRRLACPYPKDEDVEEVTLPVWVISLTTEAADRIEELEKRNASLEAAIKRQASAARTLRECTLAEVRHLSDRDRSEYFAAQTVDSERDANAMLTDRIEELEGQLKTVLDRETSILRYYDAKIDEAYAKLADAVEDFETIADTDPDGGTEWFHEVARTSIAKINGEQP